MGKFEIQYKVLNCCNGDIKYLIVYFDFTIKIRSEMSSITSKSMKDSQEFLFENRVHLK